MKRSCRTVNTVGYIKIYLCINCVHHSKDEGFLQQYTWPVKRIITQYYGQLINAM